MKDIKMRTLIKYPFLGSVIAGVELIQDTSIDTAATDGKKIYINPKFYNDLKPAEQVFLYAHEVLHIAFDHISRAKGKQNRLWNIATDAVINGLLKEDGLPLIKNGVEIVGASGKTAEMVYNELLKKQRENKQKQKQIEVQIAGVGAGGGNGQGQDGDKDQGKGKANKGKNDSIGHDSHGMWEEAIKTDQDLIDAKTHSVMVERSVKSAGNTTSSVARAFAVQRTEKPIVDWKYLLRQTLKEHIDWSYRSSEFENNILQPTIEKKPHSETEILIDTSGSVDDDLVHLFLSELFHILKVSKVKAGCFDTKFYGFEEITQKNKDQFKIIGRGGTNFDAAVNAFSRGVINRIILTDGYAPMPSKPTKAIWVVIGDHEIKPKGGKVIHITEEQLSKLNNKLDEGKSF